MTNRFISILFILLGLNSCKKDQIDGTVQTNPTLANSLESSPSSIKINNDSLLLKASVWRNFIPGNDKTGLECSCQLNFKDSLPIPSSLQLKTLYVVNVNQIWLSYNPEIENEPPSIINGVVRNGPKWEPGIFVDVVCEFEIDNQTYRIIARQQKIDEAF